QFREHQVRKLYRALVSGNVAEDEGTWEDCLLKIQDEARTEIVSADTPGARPATTRYRVLAREADTMLLEVEPLTGRMHQIRVQAASRGHPVLGDVIYGSTVSFGPPAELPRDRVIALHAYSLTFLHPLRYEPVTVTAPLPTYWSSACASLPSST